MINRLFSARRALVVAALLIAAAPTAYAAGIWNGAFPLWNTAPTASPPGQPNSGLTGNEYIAADTNLPQGLNPQTILLTVDELYAGQTVTDSTNGAITGTAAQYSGYPLIYTRLTGAISAGTNAQLPTAAAMVALAQSYSDYAVGKAWFVKVINAAGTGSGVWTMTTNTGLTLSGNMTVPVGGSRLLKFAFTSATAVTVTDYGN